MNGERYADPTADKAIANVMREMRKEADKHGKERVCENDTGRTFQVGQNWSSEKHRNKTQKKRNERNA